jgi:hypothetical protein
VADISIVLDMPPLKLNALKVFALFYRRMPQPWQELSFKNKHPRDNHIEFYEPTHVYTVNGSSKGIISCTKLLHEFFPHFDPDAVIKKMMNLKFWMKMKSMIVQHITLKLK